MSPLLKAILLMLGWIALCAFGLWRLDHGMASRGLEFTTTGHILMALLSWALGFFGTGAILWRVRP